MAFNNKNNAQTVQSDIKRPHMKKWIISFEKTNGLNQNKHIRKGMTDMD